MPRSQGVKCNRSSRLPHLPDGDRAAISSFYFLVLFSLPSSPTLGSRGEFRGRGKEQGVRRQRGQRHGELPREVIRHAHAPRAGFCSQFPASRLDAPSSGSDALRSNLHLSPSSWPGLLEIRLSLEFLLLLSVRKPCLAYFNDLLFLFCGMKISSFLD